ncbi:hypothetical protein CALVIDRAFT_317712 [Calocera viscosa TUFC12733]|uniref:Uncharacterized protein n=1 Tax=Calocera viscosa (strain TUFC12733) TaxID=1330018 RepID=A0A167HX78_CALVF|nr:hypothetical protein CALVIDRAFT_317712 [Calocera viscosa TUFC12733]
MRQSGNTRVSNIQVVEIIHEEFVYVTMIRKRRNHADIQGERITSSWPSELPQSHLPDHAAWEGARKRRFLGRALVRNNLNHPQRMHRESVTARAPLAKLYFRVL